MADNQNNINSVVDKAAKSVGKEVDAKVKAEQAALDAKIKEYNTKEAAKKIVDNSLNAIIDDAIKKAKADPAGKTKVELDQYIADIIRGHKNAFFNSDALISAAVKDAAKQLDYLIDKQVKEKINANFLTNALKPLDVAIFQKVNTKLNNELTKAIRFDVTKQMDAAIGSILKSPLKSVDVTLNKLHLGGVATILDKQVASIQTNIASNLTKNISSKIASEQKKVDAVQKQIAEVTKQVQAFEQKLKDQIKAVQDKINSEIKKVETKLVNDIAKSIKLKL